MMKFKNSFLYVLCVLLALLSSVALVTGFYVIRKDSVNNLPGESSAYRTDDNGTQNTTIIDNQNYSTTKHSLSQETHQTDASASLKYTYKVTIYEDTVAVFLFEKEKPYLKLYVDLKSIPEEDRRLLKEGIYAKNKAELIRILEDYDS